MNCNNQFFCSNEKRCCRHRILSFWDWPGCQLEDGEDNGTPPMADFTNIVECSLQDDNSIYPRTCNVQSEEYDRETPGSEDMEMERPEVQSTQVVGKG